jgi:hypothetical protein
MEPNAFVGKKTKPTKSELAQALGPALPVWERLLEELHFTPEWNSYSPKAGWSLKLKHKTRTVLYLTPCKECFHVSFVLGDKAITAAKSSDLSKRAIALIAEGKKYPEGTAVRFEAVTADDISAIKTLAQIKLAH